MVDDWFWAARNDAPAGNYFLIANGNEAMWDRVKDEIEPFGQVSWMPVHKRGKGAQLEDVLDMLITVVPVYAVNHNKFMLEAAQMPVFAEYLHGARYSLSNYVSNSVFPDHLRKVEPYSEAETRRLGHVVSRTLECQPNWF